MSDIGLRRHLRVARDIHSLLAVCIDSEVAQSFAVSIRWYPICRTRELGRCRISDFGAISVLLEIFIRSSRYVSILKWLSLSLFAYVATLFAVHVNWADV